MGRRVNYELYAGGERLGLVLYSNSSHPNVNPEAIFRHWTTECHGEPTRLIRTLLNEVYGEPYFSLHCAADHVFFVDIEPCDREVVLIADISRGTVTQVEG